MTIQSFIEKAIEGGWKSKRVPNTKHTKGTIEALLIAMGFEHILLDPAAWRAVGKVEGWKMWGSHSAKGNNLRCSCGAPWNEQTSCPNNDKNEWRSNTHRMMDALADGKTIEEYLETL